MTETTEATFASASDSGGLKAAAAELVSSRSLTVPTEAEPDTRPVERYIVGDLPETTITPTRQGQGAKPEGSSNSLGRISPR